MSELPKTVEIIEVGPRNGLQIEPHILSTSEKLRMIDALADAGLNEIEAGSFVKKAKPALTSMRWSRPPSLPRNSSDTRFPAKS